MRFKNKLYQSTIFPASGIVEHIARDDVEAEILN